MPIKNFKKKSDMNFMYFPRNKSIPDHLIELLKKFDENYDKLNPSHLSDLISDYKQKHENYKKDLAEEIKVFSNDPATKTLSKDEKKAIRKQITTDVKKRHDMNKRYKDWQLNSNDALKEMYPYLKALGYEVETTGSRIQVPVLYGKNGKVEKYFNADAYHETNLTVIEIEAGQAVINYKFLKDLFEACLMQDVKYLVIAVRNIYITRDNKTGKLKEQNDFDTVETFFHAMYSCDELKTPLDGILLIGY